MRGLTQDRIVQQLGISKSGWTHIEAGRRAPSRELLERLADELGLRLMYDPTDGWRVIG